jgi:cytochrome c biogenesis protein CcdA
MTIMSDAAGIIGHGSPSDYALSPVEHAEQLRTSAPKLAVLLTSSAPVELARQYAEADTEARVAERTFKRWVLRANWAVLATATVSALLMAAALLAGNLGSLTQAILIVLALMGVAAGGIASMSLFRVKEGRLLEDWMTARARAEIKRLSYFSTLVHSSVGQTRSPAGSAQVGVLSPLSARSSACLLQSPPIGHRNSAERTLNISAGSVLMAAIASGAAGVLGAFTSKAVGQSP